MKFLSSTILLLVFLIFSVKAQKHQLVKLWETDTLAVPESALPDFEKKIMYVTLIDGGGWTPDGKGGVGIVDFKGKILDTLWITGLNAPKGMGRIGNTLYVADIKEVVVIDMKAAKIVSKIAIDGAVALNDITVGPKNVIYVSDSRTGKIHRIENNRPSVWLEGITNVNGLSAVGSDLYIAGGVEFLKAGPDKKITKIADGFPETGDGLVRLKNGDFLLSCWAGLLYYIYKDGSAELLMDTEDTGMNIADLGYNPAENIIYVPTFNKKSIIAYQLK